MSYFSVMRTTFAWLLPLAALPVLADQVEMQNGDRYTGRAFPLGRLRCAAK